MKEFKKSDILSMAAVVILLVVFHVLVFAIPFVRTGAFWVSYVFMLISIVVQLPLLYMAFRRGDSPKSKIYGFPVARVGVLYLFVQIAFGFVCMIAAKWIHVSIAAVVDVVLLGAAGLGFIAVESVRDEIERQDVKIVTDVTTMRALQSKTNALPALCSDAEAKKALEELAEAMRYSDPVSSDATREAEADLRALTDTLEQAVADSDYVSAAALCKRCTVVLNERNRLCKLAKNNL